MIIFELWGINLNTSSFLSSLWLINAIIYAGGKPIYLEIDLKTGLPLDDEMEKKINDKTAGLVLTHLYSNKEDLLKFGKKYNQRIKIIEDAAINFGAKVDENKYLGTLFDYGFYSFGIMKHICTFNGETVNGTASSAEYIIVSIVAHENWTGYISRIDVAYS